MAEIFNPYEADTQRLKIIKLMQTLYKAATSNSANADPNKKFYGLEFSMVEVGPLGDPDARKQFALGIVAGGEKKSFLYPLADCMFDMNIEFRVTAQRDDDRPGIMAERMLGVVQQILLDLQTPIDDLGLITINEVGNEVDLYTYKDKSVQGVVQYKVHYRHSTQTMYSEQPTA